MRLVLLEQIEAGEYEYPNQIYKVPVQTGLFDHEISAPPFEYSPEVHDQHDHIDANPRKDMETMNSHA